MFSLLSAVLLLTFAFLPCDTAVVDLVVIRGKKSQCPEFFEKVKHISSLDGNLNQKAGGYYLWLCVRYGTISKEESGITDLNLFALGKKRSGCGSIGNDWTQIRREQGANGDLNQDAGGYYVYLCYRKEIGAPPIEDLLLSGEYCAHGMNRISTSDKSNGNLNQRASGKKIYLCERYGCYVTDVKGKWEVHGDITDPRTETWRYGTYKTRSESFTDDWTASVAITMERGWSLYGAEGSTLITGEVARRSSNINSDYFEGSDPNTFLVVWSDKFVGLTSWQFRFESTDSCDHIESALVAGFAVTPGESSPPCCVPDFTLDPPYYTTCSSSDSMIENGEEYGCKVGETPALSKST